MRKLMLLIIIILSIKCTGKDEERMQSVGADTLNNEEAIKSILVDQIKSFLAYNDSLYKKRDLKYQDIYWVVFKPSEGGKCKILIVTQPIYIEKDFIGYSMIDNKLIAFYNKNSEFPDCVKMFVNEDKLNKEPTEYFRDSESNYDLPPYEPLFRELKVFTDDSISVVKTFRE